MSGEAQQYQSADLSLSMFNGRDMALRDTNGLCDIGLFEIETPELTNSASDSLPIDGNLLVQNPA